MPVKKSTRSKTSMAGKRSKSAKRSSSRRSKAVWRWMPTRESMQIDRTVAAAAAFLIIVFVVAAAMAVGARGRAAQTTVAAAQLHGDESLAPEADPKRVPDAKSVAEAAAEATQPEPPQVTITGCLERSDETFRLKDASGDNVPKARSWKSGFLKKGPAAIRVVDGGSRAKLPDHVGQRVTVTGKLVDREMTVRSLQRVAASCSKA